MTIEIPAIPTQTTTEGADLFLMHNVASNRTKGITYNNLKAELTTDIDHVTSAQLASAIAGVTVDYTTADTGAFNASLSAMASITSVPTNNTFPVYDSLDGTRKITYANLKTQLLASMETEILGWITTAVNYETSLRQLGITNALALVFPIGSRISGTGPNAATNPSTYLPFTSTWVKEEGLFYVGNKSGDIDFKTTGAIGGLKSHDHDALTGGTALSWAEMPAHTHEYRDRYNAENYSVSVLPFTEPTGNHNFNYGNSVNKDWDNNTFWYKDSTTISAGLGATHYHSISSKKHLPPYKVEYVWRRTA